MGIFMSMCVTVDESEIQKIIASEQFLVFNAEK